MEEDPKRRKEEDQTEESTTPPDEGRPEDQGAASNLPKHMAAVFDTWKDLFEQNAERLAKFPIQSAEYQLFCFLYGLKITRKSFENMLSSDKQVACLGEFALQNTVEMLTAQIKVYEAILQDGLFSDQPGDKSK